MNPACKMAMAFPLRPRMENAGYVSHPRRTKGSTPCATDDFLFASGQSRMRPTLPSGSANLRIIFPIAQGVSVTGFPADVTAPSRMRGDGTRFASTPAACRTKVSGISPEFGLAMADSLRQEIADLKGVAEGYAARSKGSTIWLGRTACASPSTSRPTSTRCYCGVSTTSRRCSWPRASLGPRRHLAADRAIRLAWHQGDVLHSRSHLRALSAGARAVVQKRARACRPHVGAPRAERAGARARASAQDCSRAGKVQRPPSGWLAQPPHAAAAARRGLHLQFPRCGRSSALLRTGQQGRSICSNCRSTSPSTTPCSSASPGTLPPTASSASRTPIAYSTCGGRVSCSSIGRAEYLNICLHPFVSGRALRIAMLDRLIARMKTLPGVWFATCEEVARHCLDKHPARRGTA